MREPSFDGVFLLLIFYIVLFVADKVLHLPWVPMLYLQHSHPLWFQYVTSLFCHASFQHISGVSKRPRRKITCVLNSLTSFFF